jgi:hypothetical protein
VATHERLVDSVAEWCRVEGVSPDNVSVARVTGAPEIDADPAAVADALAQLGDGTVDPTGDSDDSSDPYERDNDGYIADPDWPGDTGAVRGHYREAAGVFGALGELGGEYPCLGHAAKSGWYRNRPATDPDVIKAGWETRTRPLTFRDDWQRILHALDSDGDDRVVYQISSWDDPDAHTSTLSRFPEPDDPDDDPDREYHNGSPTPEYADLRGFGFWVDFDLRDHLKPQRGRLDTRTRATVERAAAELIDEVAALYGVDDTAVPALDSGGGAYIYGPPEAALPIAREFDTDAGRGAVFAELRDRLVEWAKSAWERVSARVDGADDVVDPDFPQNVNRKSKAPASLHGDHDLVCTPLRARDPDTGCVTGSVDYRPTLPSEVDSETLAACEAWADRLTDTEHTDAVEGLVSTLWPAYSDDTETWADALRAWLRDKTHGEAQRSRSAAAADTDAQRRADRREEGEEGHPRAGKGVDDDAPVTPNRRAVRRAVDNLDSKRVAEATVVSEWTDAASGLTDRSGTRKRAFVPIWAGGSVGSGNANYVRLDEPVWVDTGDGGGGGPVTMALVAAGEISHTDKPDPELRSVGRQWLRDHGFAVPEWTPDAETTNPDTGEPYGTMPLWSLREAAVALDVCDRDAFVERAADGGSVVDDLSDHDGDTYLGFPDGATYNAALEACREAGLVPGREQWTDDDERPTPGRATGDDRDPTEIDVALSAATAWRAAEAVEPDDLDATPTEHDRLQLSRDGEGWVDSGCGARCNVVRAAALATGLVAHGDAEIDADTYTRAYEWARTEWGAPLPEYVDGETVTERWDVVAGALRTLQFRHFDREAVNSDVCDADDPNVRWRIDPAWRQSDSSESVLVFDDSGRIYDCDPALDRTLRPLEFVALDAGLVSWAHLTDDGGLSGDDWTTAYWLARTTYGAPLPAWDGRAARHTAVLPDLDDDHDAVDASDRLDAARDAVGELYADAANTPGADVLRVLPALGKTHQVAAQAPNRPVTYCAPRRELMLDMIDRADAAGASWYVLPAFGELSPPDWAVTAGVAAVREEGQQLLRDRDRLVEETEARLAKTDADVDSVPSPDDVRERRDDDREELPRESCPVADGEYGTEWWLAVHVARERGVAPRAMHTDANLFGGALPCTCDECVDDTVEIGHESHSDTLCPYGQAWDRASDPDHPFDVLIGHYTHAHVPTARSYIHRGGDGEVVSEPRAVALDEFPGDAYHESFGPEWRDAAVWAGQALDDGVADFADLTERGLWHDDAVRGWIDGDPTDSVVDLADTLAMLRECLARPAADAADTLTSRQRPADQHAVDVLERVRSLGLPSRARLERVHTAVADLVDDDRDRRTDSDLDDLGGALAGLRHELRDAGVDTPAALLASRLTDAIPSVAGDLQALVRTATRTLASGDPAEAVGLLDTASRALRGGRDGVERLAMWSDDGRAHPLAHTLLAGAAAPREADASTVVETESFGWSDRGTTRVQRVAVDDRDTVLVDRDGDGATVSHPPSWTVPDADDCPVVGLDGTARRRLWSLALGTDVTIRDVHDDARERRQFVREVYGVRVVQTTDDALYYEGDPSSIDLDGPTELLREIDDTHGDTPAVVTTKTVENYLKERDDAPAAEWAHYGDLTGSERLADHDVAALLGCQHWGDAVVERWAALAGEQVHRTGHGTGLSYGSPVADDALGLMRDDQVFQALLRFGRAAASDVTVYAHTGCLRDDAPVVGRGEVVRTYSETAQAVAETAAGFTGRWTRADLQAQLTQRDDAADLATSDSRLRGILRDLRQRGYVEAVDESPGQATVYGDATPSGPGEAAVPDADGGGPGETPPQYTYTWSHRVRGGDNGATRGLGGGRATLPSPDTAAAAVEGDPPPS